MPRSRWHRRILILLITISFASTASRPRIAQYCQEKQVGNLSRSLVLGVASEATVLDKRYLLGGETAGGVWGVGSFVLMSEEKTSWPRTMPQRQPRSRKHRLFAWLPRARRQRLFAFGTSPRCWRKECDQRKADFSWLWAAEKARRHEAIDESCKQVFVAQVQCLRQAPSNM
ncbi:hypothetical protein LZ32DRAFT_70282 [Colletotrichum eremochloae]|nr:hypothetical protein LZ32DRAFT_70282 [Colletotrichum eremochloae]